MVASMCVLNTFWMGFEPDFQPNWVYFEQAALAYSFWNIDIELSIQSQDLE